MALALFSVRLLVHYRYLMRYTIDYTNSEGELKEASVLALADQDAYTAFALGAITASFNTASLDKALSNPDAAALVLLSNLSADEDAPSSVLTQLLSLAANECKENFDTLIEALVAAYPPASSEPEASDAYDSEDDQILG